MFGTSRSKDHIFYDAFRDQADASVHAATGLAEMLADPAVTDRAAAAIADAGKRGGDISRSAIRTLHETWITPIDRHHIHELILGIDAITHLIDSTAARIVVFKIAEPRSESKDLAHDVKLACGHLRSATDLLPKLSTKSAAEMLRLAGEIHAIEGKADETHRRALAAVFDGGCDAVTIMKWRDVFDRLEQVTDLCHDVASLLQAIVLENA
ncbi:MAG TPA: DUF47 family protein [Polyangiaceae bacterium]|jgi:hypothetical protein